MLASDDINDLKALIAEFASSGMTALHLRSGDFELLLSNDANAGSLLYNAVSTTRPVPVVRPASPTLPQIAATTDVDLPDGALIISAPTLGTFYRAPKPGAAAYVEVGSIVDAGAELCLIEVMKLFTAVRAERKGRIHAVLAADGAMVEAGQPLFALVHG